MELDWESTRSYLAKCSRKTVQTPWYVEWEAEKQTNKIDDESLRGPELVRRNLEVIVNFKRAYSSARKQHV